MLGTVLLKAQDGAIVNLLKFQMPNVGHDMIKRITRSFLGLRGAVVPQVSFRSLLERQLGSLPKHHRLTSFQNPSCQDRRSL